MDTYRACEGVPASSDAVFVALYAQGFGRGGLPLGCVGGWAATAHGADLLCSKIGEFLSKTLFSFARYIV